MRPGVVLAGCLLLAGCGERGAADAPVETTPRAVAAVVIDHVGPQPRRARSAEDLPDGIGASVLFGADSESEEAGPTAVVDATVVPGRPEALADPCHGDRAEFLDGCERGTLEDGSTTFVLWELEEPEEDPGLVEVVVQRDDETVLVHQDGPVLTEDPREMDLPVPVAVMQDVATDRRLGLTTDRATREAGDAIEVWTEPSG